MSTASTRFELVLDPSDRRLLERAAKIEGVSLAALIRSAFKEKATTIVERESRVVLSERDAKRVIDELNKPNKPNAAMLKALALAAKVKRA